jgi:hypothetical protein
LRASVQDYKIEKLIKPKMVPLTRNRCKSGKKTDTEATKTARHRHTKSLKWEKPAETLLDIPFRLNLQKESETGSNWSSGTEADLRAVQTLKNTAPEIIFKFYIFLLYYQIQTDISATISAKIPYVWLAVLDKWTTPRVVEKLLNLHVL